MQRATQLYRAGRFGEAEALYRQVLARDPNNADLLHLLGTLVGQMRRFEESAQLLSRCVQLDPSHAAGHGSLGTSLVALGRDDEAMEHFRRAVALQPHSAEAHYNLGKALRDQKKLTEAETEFREAIRLNPNLGPAYNNLGNTVRDLGRYEESLPLYQTALRLRPNSAPTLHNLGLAYRSLMRLDEAMKAFDAALAFDPGHHEARASRAMTLLLRGEYERGWREYECRWDIASVFKKRDYPQPLWDGLDARGQTVLLHSEQGYGDTIQFVRYAPMVAARGARVIVECQPELKTLFQSLKGVAQVFAAGEPLPRFDAYRPLMSLPMLFGTTLATIPADVPYLSADAERVARFREEIGSDGLRVGLVWAGAAGYQNDRNRSLSLEDLAPLAATGGARFFSLQKGAAAKQASSPPQHMRLTDLSPELNDFADTAAAIANLDLVVCVDTAVAHLAGALAKPVWTLVAFSPDWRWLIDRVDTPWYPTMKLFRQPSIGEWSEPVRRLAAELSEFRRPDLQG
jgi:tetratricopeptide (TPR) repeat protein